MALLHVTPYDISFYNEYIKDFLPDKVIDCHTHIWLEHFVTGQEEAGRSCLWPQMVAKDNSIEDLMETNRELFPGKEVYPVLYSHVNAALDTVQSNLYVQKCAAAHHLPALYLSRPEEPLEQIERNVTEGGFCGLKVYLEFAPSYIPVNEIRIYDFLPKEQLALADRHGWVVQLHIARPRRLADPLNYIQLLEIEQNYPGLQLLVAHLGRAYADEDLGDALEYLKHTEKTIWDFTANTNAYVMEKILSYFGPKRFIYGSDFPIFRMKARRVVEKGFYINEIPLGSLGDVSGDPHIREISAPQADQITFFIYEEIAACRRAAEKLGLTRQDIQSIFYENSARVFHMDSI